MRVRTPADPVLRTHPRRCSQKFSLFDRPRLRHRISRILFRTEFVIRHPHGLPCYVSSHQSGSSIPPVWHWCNQGPAPVIAPKASEPLDIKFMLGTGIFITNTLIWSEGGMFSRTHRRMSSMPVLVLDKFLIFLAAISMSESLRLRESDSPGRLPIWSSRWSPRFSL
jgi:hypothetical protein